MIKKVTITGADHSVSPLALLELSNKFPFVEFGILFSKRTKDDIGYSRFPSVQWINQLNDLKSQNVNNLKLSLHVCGDFVQNILLGDLAGLQRFPVALFERIQLNTHGEKHDFTPEALTLIKETVRQQIIFQGDNVNTDLFAEAKKQELNHSILFDLSHGAGILPEEWPEVLDDVRCGYAGGLSPENLECQIQKINKNVAGVEVWIDMETHVRSNGDKQFDIAKVNACLQIASKYVIDAK